MDIIIDIIEDEIFNYGQSVLKILLKDRTTKKNIIWATDDYQEIGINYKSYCEIKENLITGKNTYVIQPRITKSQKEKVHRTKKRAEVFTPSWICNKQNNLIDEKWFNRENIFNVEEDKSWTAIKEKVYFSTENNKGWKEYVKAKRMEIACGEAPYLVSRYDAVTGKPIELEERIGLLDRKMRIVNENTNAEKEWFKWVEEAFKSIYGYEFQGDNLLLARENLLFTFIDNLQFKFNRKPLEGELKKIATIISWNLWQMDGLTFRPPFDSNHNVSFQQKIFSEIELDDVINENEVEKMKFDAIVGNPPYQENIGSTLNKSLSKQLYPIFMMSAIKMNPKYLSLITPSRWFTGNAQDRSFVLLREFLKKNNHFSHITNYLNSNDVFVDVSISGGVNMFLYEEGYIGEIIFEEKIKNESSIVKRPLFEEGLEIVIPMNKMITILHKVIGLNFKSMSEIVTGRNPFGVPATDAELNKISAEESSEYYDTHILCAYEQVKYIPNSCIRRNRELLNKWKVFTSKMNGGAGTLLDGKKVSILGKTFIAEPNMSCSNTLLAVGGFENEIEAVNLNKYMNCKFFRFMLGIKKIAQVLTSNVYSFVPQQNFKNNSDIDWNKSIEEIDKQLYIKYKLNEQEILYIEENIKAVN